MKKYAYGILTAAHILAGIAAVWVRRPLFSDGYAVLTRIIQYGDFHLDGRYTRFINIVLQIPAFIISRYMHFLTEWNSWTAVAFCTTYALHPYVSWAICYFILRRYKKIEYMVFPLISYALVTVVIMLYPSLTLPETVSVFWPLFLILIFSKLKSYKSLAAIASLSFLMANGYETAIALFAINAVVLCSRRQWGLPIVLQVIGFLFVAFRLWGPYGGPQEAFFEALGQGLFSQGYRLFSITGLLFFVSLIIQPRRWVLILAVLISSGALYWGLHEIWDSPGALYDTTFVDRTRATPLICIIALMAFWASQKKGNLRLLHYFCFFTLAVSVVYDGLIIYYFNKTMEDARRMASENPGCNVIETLDFEDHLYEKGHSWWLMYSTSQIDRTLKPSSVFFMESNADGRSCDVKNNVLGHYEENQIPFPLEGPLDYSLLVKKPSHQLKWDHLSQKWNRVVLKK